MKKVTLNNLKNLKERIVRADVYHLPNGKVYMITAVIDSGESYIWEGTPTKGWKAPKTAETKHYYRII